MSDLPELDVSQLYTYRADVVSVYDGDTITAMVDLGFDSYRKMKFRLYGIDAWERRGVERPLGIEAGDWLRDMILGETIYTMSIKDRTGKYGRYLAVLFIEVDGEMINLNERLVELGHAEFRDY